MPVSTKLEIKVADEVWITTALLHRELPSATDFSVEEIVRRAKRETLHSPHRSSVYVHVVQHCVANRAPNSGRYRMLYETTERRRRLFRRGDAYHPGREGSKITPESADMPRGYEDLLKWYEEWSVTYGDRAAKSDPLLALAGSGRNLWSDEHADEYVRRLREGWE